jgi:hypothetical protein
MNSTRWWISIPMSRNRVPYVLAYPPLAIDRWYSSRCRLSQSSGFLLLSRLQFDEWFLFKSLNMAMMMRLRRWHTADIARDWP